MAKTKSEYGFGRILLQVALGLMMAIAGIWALQGGGDAAAQALEDLFSSDTARILKIVFGVIEILAGIILILGLFVKTNTNSLQSVLTLIITIVWIVAIVVADFLPLFKGNVHNFLNWLYTLSMHLTILGAIIIIR